MDGFQLFTIDAPAGVNFSREPSQLNPQLWDEAHNVTFRHGKTFKNRGFEEGFGSAVTLPEIIVPLRDDSNRYYWWAYAGKQRKLDEATGKPTEEDKIYKVISSRVHDDVTPTGGVITPKGIWLPERWTGDSLNGTPYLCKEKPYVWNDANNRFEVMNKFPNFLSFKTMRTFRNFLVGLNFHTTDDEPDVEGFSSWSPGTHQNALWWSHDIAGTSLQVGEKEKSLWCDSDPNRNSGWNYLGGTGGPIVDGKSMRDSFIIYRERSVWQMTFVGGINIFNFKELFDDAGVLSINCVEEVEGQHFVVGQSDVYVHNGVSKKSIVDGVVRRAIFENISADHVDRVFTSVDYANKEFSVNVPWHRPEGDPYAGSCNIAFVYNWEEQTWSRRDIPDLLCSTYTILSIPDDDSRWIAETEFQPWTSAQDTWLNTTSRYNAADWGSAMGSMRSIKYDSGFVNDWVEEQDWAEDAIWDETERSQDSYHIFTGIDECLYNGEDFEAIVEKKWMTMGDYTDSTFVSKIFPFVRGTASTGIGAQVEVYMSGTNRITDDPSWKYIGLFDAAKMDKLSCRISGEFIHVKFVIPKSSRAEIRGYSLEWQKIGRRY